MYIWVGVSPPNSWKLILEMYLRPNWTLISSLTLYQLKEVFIENSLDVGALGSII